MAVVSAAPLRQAYAYAAAMILAIGIPMLGSLAWTLWQDWTQRYQRAPLQALLGEELEARLRRGERPPKHYLGNDRLAPDFRLEDAQGRPWRLREQRGKLVVLNFWSVTCRPCIEEMPALVELAGIVSSWPDVEVVTVSIDRDRAAAQAVLPKNSRLKVLFDPARAVVTGRYGTKLFPETWLIDRHGVIRLRLDGPQPWSSPLMLELLESFR